MRAQADLVLYIEKRERLMAQRTSTCYSACNFDPLSWGIGVQN